MLFIQLIAVPPVWFGPGDYGSLSPPKTRAKVVVWTLALRVFSVTYSLLGVTLCSNICDYGSLFSAPNKG
jgi:hypothetical protein